MPLAVGYLALLAVGVAILVVASPLAMLLAAVGAIVIYAGFYFILRSIGEFPGDRT